MEFLDFGYRILEIACRNPFICLRTISCPSNKIPKLTSSSFTIEDCFNFILFFPFNYFRGRI